MRASEAGRDLLCQNVACRLPSARISRDSGPMARDWPRSGRIRPSPTKSNQIKPEGRSSKFKDKSNPVNQGVMEIMIRIAIMIKIMKEEDGGMMSGQTQSNPVKPVGEVG